MATAQDLLSLGSGQGPDLKKPTVNEQILRGIDLIYDRQFDDAEDLFVEGLNLDGSIWSSYAATIARDSFQNSDATLVVPEDYTGTGAMEGTVIFWATEAP